MEMVAGRSCVDYPALQVIVRGWPQFAALWSEHQMWVSVVSRFTHFHPTIGVGQPPKFRASFSYCALSSDWRPNTFGSTVHGSR
jgi:hypothetical protein